MFGITLSARVHAKSLHLCQTLCDPLEAPLSVGFSRQEYWSGLPCPPPRDLPDLGIEPTSLASPALAGGFFTTSTTWEISIKTLTWCCEKSLSKGLSDNNDDK